MLRVIGVILIILGVLGFIFRSVSFTDTEEVADVGPVEVETEQTETIPLTPIASGVAVVAGIALVVVGTRRSQA